MAIFGPEHKDLSKSNLHSCGGRFTVMGSILPWVNYFTFVLKLKRCCSKFIIDTMAAKSKKKKTPKSKASQTDPIQAAIDYGIDVSMLIDNLGRSIAERIKRHQIALNTTEKLRKAREM